MSWREAGFVNGIDVSKVLPVPAVGSKCPIQRCKRGLPSRVGHQGLHTRCSAATGVPTGGDGGAGSASPSGTSEAEIGIQGTSANEHEAAFSESLSDSA